MMTSTPEKFGYEAAKKLSEGDMDENKEFKNWVKNMERLGESYVDENGVIDVDGYLQRYEEIYDSYEGKGDFPHMLYTIAAGLVDNDKKKKVQYKKWNGGGSGLGWSTSEERKDIAGWLGNALYAPEGKTSFGYDDFVADLDADNIVYRMDAGVKLIEVIEQYYQTLPLDDKERIKEFLDNNSYTYVEDTICDRLKLKDKNKDKKIDLEGLDKTKYEATYDFLKSLKEVNDE